MDFKNLDAATVIEIHGDIVEEFGGLAGICPDKSLDGALGRIDNYVYYEGVEDIFLIAALYGIALAQGHIFNDANKRTAFLSMYDFLLINGYLLLPESLDGTDTMVSVAYKKISHEELAKWLEKNTQKSF
jgi:death-on-curing protein